MWFFIDNLSEKPNRSLLYFFYVIRKCLLAVIILYVGKYPNIQIYLCIVLYILGIFLHIRLKFFSE